MSSRFQTTTVDNRFGIPTKCCFCNQNNVAGNDRCSKCFASLDYSQSAAGKSGPTKPKLISTLGPPASGKTVFLGLLLDILSRQSDRTEFSASDGGSMAIQQDTLSSLENKVFPEPTEEDPSRWRWAHCRVGRRARKQPHDVFVTDLSGDSLVQELEHPGATPLLAGLFRQSFGTFLCTDAGEAQSGNRDVEFYALRILSHLLDIRQKDVEDAARKPRRKKRKGKTQPAQFPIAVLLTKADECESLYDNPAEFAQMHLPKLWELGNSAGHPIEYFATSAVGRVAIQRDARRRPELVPLRVEPRGILEPMRWLLSQARG